MHKSYPHLVLKLCPTNIPTIDHSGFEFFTKTGKEFETLEKVVYKTRKIIFKHIFFLHEFPKQLSICANKKFSTSNI